MSKKSITYIGNGQVRVEMPDGGMFEITKGTTVKRGEIPNDAFDGLSLRPDFGASLEEYRLHRARRGAPPRPEPQPKPKAAPKEDKPAKADRE